MTSALLHSLILRRDGACVGVLYDREHVCRDRWGQVHHPADLDRLTVDHVHAHAGGTKGKRAPDSPHNLVAMCWDLNVVRTPSRDLRQWEREYLIRINKERPITWPQQT